MIVWIAIFVVLLFLVVLLALLALLVSYILESYRCDRRICIPGPDFYSLSSYQHLFNWWCGKNSCHESFPSMYIYFPRHILLQNNWKKIKREASKIKKYFKTIKNDLFFEDIADDGWKRFYIKWYGPCLPEARKLCPFTCSLLDQLPEVHLAMFSYLEPNTCIPGHFGPFRGSLRYHLGLKTPQSNKCFISVDETKYSWRNGKDILFDDTFYHFVENKTSKPRLILFCDVERKMRGPTRQRILNWACRTFGPQTTRDNNLQEKIEEL